MKHLQIVVFSSRKIGVDHSPHLFRLSTEGWTDVTTSTDSSRVCGSSDTLGTFTLFAADATPPLIVPHVEGPLGNDGWYTGAIGDFTTWLDYFHQGYPSVELGVSEYGAGMGASLHSDTPASQDHSEEYQLLFHENYWGAMTGRPFLWGKFIWNMFDFAVDSRNEGG